MTVDLSVSLRTFWTFELFQFDVGYKLEQYQSTTKSLQIAGWKKMKMLMPLLGEGLLRECIPARHQRIHKSQVHQKPGSGCYFTACESISFPNKIFHIPPVAPGFLLIQQCGWFRSEREHLREIAPWLWQCRTKEGALQGWWWYFFLFGHCLVPEQHFLSPIEWLYTSLPVLTAPAAHSCATTRSRFPWC